MLQIKHFLQHRPVYRIIDILKKKRSLCDMRSLFSRHCIITVGIAYFAVIMMFIAAPFATVFAESNDIQNTLCVTTDSLGDSIEEALGPSAVEGELALPTIISNSGLVTSSQKQYQIWHKNGASTTIEVTFLDGYTWAGDVFGYYIKGHPESFVPIFKYGRGTNSIYSSVATATPGQIYTVVVPGEDIGFAVHKDFEGLNLRTSENSLNENGEDYMIAYDVATSTNPNYGTYVLAFEDIFISTSDKDHNDIVVKVTVKLCESPTPVNHPPVITLIGANPTSVVVGNTYTDLGATAEDQEDGDLTAHIVITGSVNTSTTSTSTLIYSIIDSGGLSASTTRVVIVSATSTATTTSPSDPPNNPPPSGGGGGSGGSSRPPGGGGVVLSASTSLECFYLRDYMRRDFDNDPLEVLKLQAFLINFEGHSDVTLTGVFDQATFDAVSAFQMKYFKDILEPWGHTGPTGYVYILTQKKINEIYCQRLFPLNQAQINEIVVFRAFLESLRTQEIKPQLLPYSTTTPSILPIVGEVELPEPSQGQNLRNLATAATTYMSDWWYLILPLLIVLAVFIFWTLSPSKYNSMRASIKSWYLVGLARTKSILKKTKETPKKPVSLKEEPIKWNIKKEPAKLVEEEVIKDTEVIILGPKK